MENHSKRQREDETQPSGNQQKPTVCFNVGGKIYEVSRSLLEQYPDTMLARMASDTWLPAGNDSDDNGKKRKKNDNGSNDDEGGDEEEDDDDKSNKSALFIERDGDRFKFCLDYMRDGGMIGLPLTVSKEALLQDLAFYGFQDVDPSSISVKESLPTLVACQRHMRSFRDDFYKKVYAVRRNWETMEIVGHLLTSYCSPHRLSSDSCTGGTSRLITIQEKDCENIMHLKYDDKSDFVKHLKSVGLKCKATVYPLHEKVEFDLELL